jgi:phosphatidylglycerophosphate synthase
MARGSRWLTWANALSGLRLLLAAPLAGCVLTGRPVLGTLVFFTAVASDFADGWVARRRGDATPLGGVFDHAVDAVFVSTGCAAWAAAGALPAPLPAFILAAFLQYALDSRVLVRRGLRGSALGRVNGIAYYVIVAVPLVRDALGLAWPGPGLVKGLGWGLVATSALSMLDRLRLLLRRRARNPSE